MSNSEQIGRKTLSVKQLSLVISATRFEKKIINQKCVRLYRFCGTVWNTTVRRLLIEASKSQPKNDFEAGRPPCVGDPLNFAKIVE